MADSVLSHKTIANAKQAVADYAVKANAEFEELSSTINSLRAAQFIGDASDGYYDFFTTKITPALTDNLTGANSIISGINSLLDAVEQTLLDQVDPKLGEGNRNPGTAE